jgi:hypothetical protein
MIESAPETTDVPVPPPSSWVGASTSPDIRGGDPLAEIDELIGCQRARLHEAEERASEAETRQRRFLDAFTTACEREVDPAMNAVIDRLRRNGGGGYIEKHSGHEPRFQRPNIQVWLSLDGDLTRGAREDRHVYLRLDADPIQGCVQVRAGDMWNGFGGHSSGLVGTWQLADITINRVEHAILEILRRAAQAPTAGQVDL